MSDHVPELPPIPPSDPSEPSAPLPPGGPFTAPPPPGAGGPFTPPPAARFAGPWSPGINPRSDADLGPTYRSFAPMAPALPSWADPLPRPTRPEHGSGLAIAALVVACQALLLCLLQWWDFGWAVLLGVLALLLGIPAMVRAARGRSTGTGLAIAAVIVALLGTSIGTYRYVQLRMALHDLVAAIQGTPIGAASPGGIRADGKYPFTTTITFQDGVRLTVGNGVPYTPPKAVLTDPGTPTGQISWVTYTVTLVNGSKKPIYPATTQVTAETEGGHPIQRDTADFADPFGPTRVAPGATMRWTVGCIITNPGPVTFHVAVVSGYQQGNIPFHGYQLVAFTDRPLG